MIQRSSYQRAKTKYKEVSTLISKVIQKDNNDASDQKDIKDKMMTTNPKKVNKTINGNGDQREFQEINKKCISHRKTTWQYFLNKISCNLPSLSHFRTFNSRTPSLQLKVLL